MNKVIILLIFSSQAFISEAQRTRPEREQRPSQEEMIEKATKELSLTDEQIAEWKKIHDKYAEAMKASRSQARETKESMGKELEAILNEDQLKKFREMREKRRPGGRRDN